MLTLLKRLIDKLGESRWLAVPAGALVSLASAFSIWFLFALIDYSLAVRDNVEQSAGPISYILFFAVFFTFLFPFWLGACSIVYATLRRRDKQSAQQG
jgi:hypothetical protein